MTPSRQFLVQQATLSALAYAFPISAQKGELRSKARELVPYFRFQEWFHSLVRQEYRTLTDRYAS